MSLSKLPSIQPKRFDREELGAVAIALTNSAVKGPTYLRVDGKIAFVVLAVEVFDQVWPDSRRAYATAEMPEYLWNKLLEGFERQRNDEARNRASHQIGRASCRENGCQYV